MTEISRLEFLKMVHVLLTWHVVLRTFDRNESTIYCLQACFRQSGSEKDRPRSGRPRITTPRAVRFMVTSSRRDRFVAAPKLVERLRYATGTLIYVFTKFSKKTVQ